MALKFDGKYLKDGSTTLCRVEGDKIKEGFNRSTTLCRVEGDNIKEGFNKSTTLCRVEGDKIKEGFNRSTTLIKTSDAARKIGATSLSPTTAAIWYLFCR